MSELLLQLVPCDVELAHDLVDLLADLGLLLVDVLQGSQQTRSPLRSRGRLPHLVAVLHELRLHTSIVLDPTCQHPLRGDLDRILQEDLPR